MEAAVERSNMLCALERVAFGGRLKLRDRIEFLGRRGERVGQALHGAGLKAAGVEDGSSCRDLSAHGKPRRSVWAS